MRSSTLLPPTIRVKPFKMSNDEQPADLPWTILRTLQWTTGFFSDRGIENPRADAEVLLAATLECQRIDLYLRHDQPLHADELERFRERFYSKAIAIDNQLGGVPDESMVAVVDVGLISQVYANLFSNALKYTRAAHDAAGTGKEFIAYGQEILKDYFRPGKDGVKFNVFNTGLHIPTEEREHIFDDGYRGKQASGQPGTGHGLSFVKRAVEIHDGVVGYEPTHLGNNFYFILPA